MKHSANSQIAIIILVYFIIRTHGIAGYMPSIWVIPLGIIIIFSIVILFKLPKPFLNQLLKNSKWIILSIIFLLICIYFRHGNFKLDETFKYLSISIPFYIIGYYWGLNGKDVNYKNIVVWYFIFLSLYLSTKLLQINSLNNITKETLGQLFYTTDGLNLNDMIFFWSFASFVFIIANIYIWKKKNSNVFFKLIFIICFLFSFLISGFAAPFALIITTILFFYFIRLKGKLRLLVVSPFIFLLVYFIIYLLGSGVIGTFGAITSKTNGILLLFKSDKSFDIDIINEITSNRWTAAYYSIDQFLDKPLIGQGAYLDPMEIQMGNIDNYTFASGGHSFVFDSLAYFGIWGILLIMILINFSIYAIKYFRIAGQDDKNAALIYASAIIAFSFSNILKAGFLMSNFDTFIFLTSGFFLGKYYLLKHTKI